MKQRSFLICGCSHGHLINDEAAAHLLRFKKKFKPDVTVHLGDFIDASAFMGSGKGTDTDADNIWRDLRRGLDFLERLEPQIVFCGNHEFRLWKLLEHKNAIIQDCAATNIDRIRQLCKKLKAELVEYGEMYNPKSFRQLGPLALCHGWSFGMNAEREHAQMTGKPTIMAHVHRQQRQPAYAFNGPEGVSVGLIGDISRLKYAAHRKATSGWTNGFVKGWVTANEYELTLEKSFPWVQPKIPKI